jgi:aryl-alcohol dehydrogenase-like predicted oxidoreductase
MTDPRRVAFSRREALAMGAGLGLAATLPFPRLALAQSGKILERPIPHSGEMLPVVGLGTAVIFEFDANAPQKAERTKVIQTMIDGGAKLIDTAPSYGPAEERIGEILSDIKARDRIFLATKVRVADRAATEAEMRRGLQKLRTEKLDLMQLHNVRDPKQSLEQIREWKGQGICRYVGMTSSFVRDYDAVFETLKREKPDFFQINYSLADRQAEAKLLPMAQEVGAAVLINLPFGRGKLFKAVANRPLPDWAKEIDATSWAQVFLKFLLSHPAVTAVIPGSDKVEYMVDNLKAGQGRLPDAAMRKKMISFWESLG